MRSRYHDLRHLLTKRQLAVLKPLQPVAWCCSVQSAAAKAAVAAQLHAACRDVGFFYVKNAGAYYDFWYVPSVSGG